MRYLIILSILFFGEKANAQMGRDSIELKIVSFKDTVAKMEDGAINIKLLLINHSKAYSLIVPSSSGELYAFAKQLDPPVYYEIIYLGNHRKDTLFNKFLPMDINRMGTGNDLLYPGEKKNIICRPDFFYFKKAGAYKIRIGFRASRLNRCYKDVITNWISIYIKDPG